LEGLRRGAVAVAFAFVYPSTGTHRDGGMEGWRDGGMICSTSLHPHLEQMRGY